MKIKSGLKIRNVAGENIVMVRTNTNDSTSKLLALNPTSVYLWESLAGKDFKTEDVSALLLDRYEVDEDTAGRDAAAWVTKMEEAGVLE